jgi:rhodanese-related sulfurtransferase
MIYIKNYEESKRRVMDRVIIDVREPYEYMMGHVNGAINIPPAILMQGVPKQLADLPKDTEIVLYCLSGARSRASMHYLAQYGFTNLVNGINKDQVKAKYL